jgi:NAD-dependent deacetylase
MSVRIPEIPSELIAALKSIQRVAVLTGAGISAESGIPTFREAQTGLWSRYDPQDLATPEAFRRNPRLVWEWYTWRRELISLSEPNPGHLALVEMEQLFPQFTLITQNVDDLHQKAGTQSIIQLHGDIFRTKCSEEDVLVPDWPDTGVIPPQCPSCNSPLRPDVVWFGESLPAHVIQAAIQAASSCQAFFSIGTSTLVEPAASLPFIAMQQGAYVIEINPEITPLTRSARWSVFAPAGQALPTLMQEFSRS